MYGKKAQCITIAVLLIVSLMCIVPLLLVVASSFTSERALEQNGYSLLPS